MQNNVEQSGYFNFSDVGKAELDEVNLSSVHKYNEDDVSAGEELDEFRSDSDFERLAMNYFGMSRKYTHLNIDNHAENVTPSNAGSVQKALLRSRLLPVEGLPEAPFELLEENGLGNLPDNSASYLRSDSTRSSLAFNLNLLQSRAGSMTTSQHGDVPHRSSLRYSMSFHKAPSTHNISRTHSIFIPKTRRTSIPSRSNSVPNLQRKGSLLRGLSFGSLTQLKGISRYEVRVGVSFDDIEEMEYLTQGAMCNVYQGKLGRKVVIFKIPRNDSPSTSVNDLEMEIVLLKELSHPNIVSVICAGETPEGIPFMGMEPLMGGTLSVVVSKFKKNAPLSQGLQYALQLAQAFEFLHQEAIPGHVIIHRDLKPDNVCFTKSGKMKIVDFGLAKVVRRKYSNLSEAYTMTALTGSLRFMAPEVGLNKPYNEKVDVYSWSLVTWFILTRLMPYRNLSVSNFQENVFERGMRPNLDETWPENLQNLLIDCWDGNYLRRPNFKVITVALENVLSRRLSYTPCCTLF